METAIKVDKLCKSYAGIHVVESLKFYVSQQIFIMCLLVVIGPYFIH